MSLNEYLKNLKDNDTSWSSYIKTYNIQANLIDLTPDLQESLKQKYLDRINNY